MPPSNAGALGDPAYLQITAFILQSNGVPLDAKNLPGAPSAKPRTPASNSPGGGLSPYASLIPAQAKPNPLDKLTLVTDAEAKTLRPASGSPGVALMTRPRASAR